MSRYYSRDGTPMSLMEWAHALEPEKQRVAADELDGYYVSTVWLGLDHNYHAEGPPLIFETMVFKQGDAIDLYRARYSTEEEAARGHKQVVAGIASGALKFEVEA